MQSVIITSYYHLLVLLSVIITFLKSLNVLNSLERELNLISSKITQYIEIDHLIVKVRWGGFH